MNRIAPAFGLALCLPLMSQAMERTSIDEELNGLSIETEIVGSLSEAKSATAGMQMLQVTNNEAITVVCDIEPAADEADAPAEVSVAPGQSATLQLGSDYASATTRARLHCSATD